MTNNFLPFLEVHSKNRKPLRLLIDTGANRNYINPDIVPRSAVDKGSQHKIKNINGTHDVNEFTHFNPFAKFSKKLSSQKFFLFKFHNYFDGLIGFETLRSLNAIIDTASNSLIIRELIIPLCRKYPESIQINSNETKSMIISTCMVDGDFFLENEIEILPKIKILSGLYKSLNCEAKVLIHSYDDDSREVNICDMLNAEINNFEEAPIKGEHKCKSDFLDSQLRLDHLNSEEKPKLLKVLHRFQDIFYDGEEKLTFTNAIHHEIVTKDEFAVYGKSYRYPYCHREEVRRQISKMLDQGIIRPSNSPWSSPVWVVPKKLDASGQRKWRLVIDYRKLNDKTLDDRYPIPNITDILDKLGRCQYFTTLDLASGFHQIEVKKKDIHKTAFSVEGGHYEFVRMPFGLKNAPATFQRVMDNVLRDHIGVICLVYMDDIIIFSTSLQEHLINLSKIMETLRKYNLKVQIDKCDFLQKEVAFLGHVITPEGVRPNPDKIKVIQEWPLPKNEKELKGFLGVIGYYRKFIKDFAKIAKPLTQQLRKGETISHTPEFVSAFNRCKNILTSSHVLQYPDLSKRFILTTDASNYALGAVLSQGPVGQDRPVAFASRTLTLSEEKYSAIEKELLAIDWACKYFRPYLFGRRFTLYTDHKPLTYALNLKTSNDRLVRMKLRLEQFDYEIQYRPGKQNVVADGLSRITQEINANETDSSSDAETVHSADSDSGSLINMTETPINFFKSQILIRKGSSNGAIYETIFPGINRHTLTRATFGVPVAVKIFREYMHPSRVNCILCPEEWINTLQVVYRNHFARAKSFKVILTQSILQDVISEEEQDDIIERVHERAHRGATENDGVIKKEFYFPKIKQRVQKYINLCETCLESKYERSPYKPKFAYTPLPTRPLDILHVDIFISAPYLFLSAIDKLSRYAILIPIKSRSIPDVKRGIIKLVTTFGTPKMIVCDNEVALKSIEIRGLLQRLNVEIYYTPSDHSEVNGIVERFHSTLSEIFRCMKDKYPDLTNKEIYKIATSLYNTTIHTATKLKPVEVFFGIKEGEERPLNLQRILENRNEIFDEIIQQLESYQKKTIDSHNKNRNDEPNFEAEDEVYNRTAGIPDKRRKKFRKQIVRLNNRKTIIDRRNIKIHKSKLKRKRKL